MDRPTASVDDPIATADWRRRVFALYAAVRAGGDARAAWNDWRTGRERLMRTHPASPLSAAKRRAFAGLGFFDYDPALRLAVETAAPDDRRPLVLDLGRDGQAVLEPAALTRGLESALGAELTIFWIAGYGGGLFLPFRDAGNGTETYGGGRYLLDTIKGADLGESGGRLVLDFNFAYNPSCAYSPRWTCPLAPVANTLPVPVRGGEKDARPRRVEHA